MYWGCLPPHPGLVTLVSLVAALAAAEADDCAPRPGRAPGQGEPH